MDKKTVQLGLNKQMSQFTHGLKNKIGLVLGTLEMYFILHKKRVSSKPHKIC